MTLLILAIAIPAGIGVAGWWALLFWGARRDGEFQRQHDAALKP